MKEAQKEKAPFAHGALSASVNLERFPTTRSMIVGCDIARQLCASICARIFSVRCSPRIVWGRIMPGGRPPSFNSFICPNCGAYYQVVKVEAGPETDNREITCRSCGGPLSGREGQFVLKYFLLRNTGRSRRRA